MKPFDVGTKVEILYSAGDNAPDWTPATVVKVVEPNIVGIGQTGNIVQLDSGKYVIVTEPGMIVKA